MTKLPDFSNNKVSAADVLTAVANFKMNKSAAIKIHWLSYVVDQLKGKARTYLNDVCKDCEVMEDPDSDLMLRTKKRNVFTPDQDDQIAEWQVQLDALDLKAKDLKAKIKARTDYMKKMDMGTTQEGEPYYEILKK